MASRKRIFKCIAVLIALIAAVCFGSVAKALADSRYDYENPDTGYCVKIIDGSDLMSDEDEELLAEHMKMMTEYGNAVFYLLENNPLTAEEASGNKYNALFGEENGVLFLIDYENEQIYLKNNGDFAYWLEPGTSNSILSDALDNLGDGGDVDLAIDVFDQYFEAIDSSDRQYHYEASTGEDGFTDESTADLKDTTASFLVVSAILLSFMQAKNINKIKISSILIERWNAKRIAISKKAKYKNLTNEETEKLIKEQERIQANLTEKFLRTFLRLSEQYNKASEINL